MHELFVIGFILPYVPYRRWRLRGAPKVLGMVRTVYFVLRDSTGDAGSVLLQLQLLPKRMASMSGVLAQGLLLS